MLRSAMTHVLVRRIARCARRYAPLGALVALGGCFATRNDVRVIQTDVASLRMEMVRNDAQIRADLQATTELLRAATDSVMRLSARTVSIQGDLRGETRVIREQLLQIQSLLGQSAATIARLRAEMERTSAPQAAPTPPVAAPPAAGTTRPPDTTATASVTQPGPAMLYTNGRDQLSRGSVSTARALFQELLLKFPNSDLAPDAQYQIAETFAREKNVAAADVAYAAVVTNYPTHQYAGTSLYKRAGLAEQRKDLAEAKRLYGEVVAKYPRSDEAALAAEKLKAIP